jgi:hypothetical protein
MQTKLLLGILFLGIVVLALGGWTVSRSRRAVKAALRPIAPAPA